MNAIAPIRPPISPKQAIVGVYTNFIGALDSALSRGVDPDTIDDYGRSLLNVAASRHWVEGVRRLLSAGADSDLVDQSGLSPLISAVKASLERYRDGSPDQLADQDSDCVKVCRDLLEMGADKIELALWLQEIESNGYTDNTEYIKALMSELDIHPSHSRLSIR